MNDYKAFIINVVLEGYKKLMDVQWSESDVRMTILLALERARPREVKDLVAFVTWSRQHGKEPIWIAGNLMHDLNGILNYDPCFLPRTSGYSDLV